MIPSAPVEAWLEWKDRLDLYLAYDHGTRAPAVALLLALMPGDIAIPGGALPPAGSIVALDEVSTAVKGRLDLGRQLPVSEIANLIKGMCETWGVEPRGVCDPSIDSNIGNIGGSILQQFATCGVDFSKANNERVGGWSELRRRFYDTGRDTGRPWLLLDRRCVGPIRTLPSLVRDPRRPEDIDKSSADHWADALRYGVMSAGPSIQVFSLQELGLL